MIELCTSTSGSVHCPVVCLFADSSQSLGQIVVSEIEDHIKSGGVFNEGDTFQVEWSINRFKKRDTCLLLQEPDMETLPVKSIDGSVQSLRHLKLQNQMVASCGLEGLESFASMAETALIGKDVCDNDKQLLLSRSTSQGGMSEWFIGKFQSGLDYESAENLEHLTLYEAAIRYPLAIQFFALPNETKVLLTEDSMKVMCNNKIVRDDAF